MTLDACARIVAEGDPDRFATLMAAPVPVRARLLPLYAFNLEVARAPWASAEPMIAEMRLQWWADLLEDIAQRDPPAHEVAAPLAQLVRDAGLPVPLLEAMVEARRADIYGDRPTPEAFTTYINATAGHLMWLAALALGSAPAHEDAVRREAQGQGVAALLQATAELEARGRPPLPDDDIAGLATRTLARLGPRPRLPRDVRPAIWPAWQARGLLAIAAQHPDRVREGRLALPEIRKRGGLLARAWLG